MDPATIAAIAASVSAVSAVATGVTSYMSGQANAAMAKSEAEQALAVGQQEAARTRRLVAHRQAAFLAQAEDTNINDSPMQVYLANAKQGELEAQDKIYAARLRAGSKIFEGDLASMKGTGGLISGSLKGVSEVGPIYDWLKGLNKP